MAHGLVYVILFCIVVLGLVIARCWCMCQKQEEFIDYFSTCNLDAFFSPDFSTNLQSRRHWIRQQTAAEKAYESELLQRTDLNDTDLETMIDDLKAYHVQLRLAGLQKLQQSKSSDFVDTLKDNPLLKYSCTFTPQQYPLFTISGKRTCNVVNEGKVFTNPRLKPTTVDGVALSNTCYISLPANTVDSDTRRVVLADVNQILEAVGEKADAFTLKQISDLKAAIESLKKQTEEIKTVTIPDSQMKEEAKKKDYLKAANDYKAVSYQMSDENPSNIYTTYYSLL
jgi:hypothetical protein